ncbi:MAG: flagellar hook assembly protein FlgD [Candidatus Anammoxibacter sp.]
MEGISSAAGVTGVIEELDRNAFLKLFVAQLKNQDPLAPQENGAFIAQLAQFSSLESLEELTQLTITQNEILTDQLNEGTVSGLLQELNIAASLIGKDITYRTADGSTATGTVDGVDIGDDSLSFDVGGVKVAVADLLGIKKT